MVIHFFPESLRGTSEGIDGGEGIKLLSKSMKILKILI